MANLSNINNKFLVTTGGNVGIGVTGPITKLNVAGNIAVTATKAYRMYNAANNGWGEMSFIEADNRIQFNRGIQNSGVDWRLSENSASSYVCALQGNFGIGTTSPQQKLTLGSVSAGGIQFNYDSTNNYRHQILNYWNSNTDSRMDFNIARTSGQTPETIMSVGYSGNVGIGTTSPVAKLDITSTTSGSEGLRVDGASGGFAFVVKGGTDYTTHTRAGATIGVNYFTTPPANGLIVEGNVGIGTSSPDRSLDVRGDGMSIYGTGGYSELMLRGQVEGTGTVRNVGAWHWSVRADVGGNNDDLKLLRFNTGSYAGTAMVVRSDNGGIAIGQNNSGYSSQILSVNSATSDNVFYGESSDANCFASFRDNSSTANIEYGAIGNAHVFRKDASEYMRIDGNGNVGIGDTSPQGKLEVSQNMSNGAASAFTSPHLRLSALNTTDSTGFVGMTFATSTADNYGFSWGALRTVSALGGMHLRYHGNSASGTDIFNIDYVGNVTIPSTRFIRSDSSAGYLIIQGGATYPGGRIEMYGGSNAAAGIIFSTGTTTTSPAERMRIDSSGVVKISNTGDAILTITSGTTNTAKINFGDSSNDDAGIIAYTNDAGGSDTMAFTVGTSEKMRIINSGNIGIGTTSPSEKLDVAGIIRSKGNNNYENILTKEGSTGSFTFTQTELNAGIIDNVSYFIFVSVYRPTTDIANDVGTLLLHGIMPRGGNSIFNTINTLKGPGISVLTATNSGNSLVITTDSGTTFRCAIKLISIGGTS